jgi:type 2 lantibiotic biosynthesis protein LanM
MSAAKFLHTAEEIGVRLCSDALWSGDHCNWIGAAVEYTGSQWQVTRRPAGPDLYSGAGGIGLFLAYLFSCTLEQNFRKTAEGAIRYALSHLDRLNSAGNFGFYSGLTGLAYVLAETAEIFGAPQFVEKSLTLLRESERQATLRRWDIVSGSAGVIPVLLKLHSGFGAEFLLDLALRHGDMLLQSAHRGDEGWSWTTGDGTRHRNLTGFSHGTAGVAWSLLELHSKSGNQRFLNAAQEAFRYERHWYSPQWENWPDFRSSSETGDPGYVAGWCHGAPGIGLSRVRAFQLFGDPNCRAEAEIAVRTTTRILNSALSNGQGNYSLCHGHCGNAELLICAGDVLGDEGSIKAVHQIAEDALQKYSIEKNPWPCGVLNGGETPDLMLGLAGIGHFYLRLYDRQKTPSVLLVGPK